MKKLTFCQEHTAGRICTRKHFRALLFDCTTHKACIIINNQFRRMCLWTIKCKNTVKDESFNKYRSYFLISLITKTNPNQNLHHNQHGQKCLKNTALPCRQSKKQNLSTSKVTNIFNLRSTFTIASRFQYEHSTKYNNYFISIQKWNRLKQYGWAKLRPSHSTLAPNLYIKPIFSQ